MKFGKIALLMLTVIAFSSCNELQQVVNAYGATNNETTQENKSDSKPLTTTEVDSGLKQALKIGAKKAVEILATKDGFYKDELVKIMLPEQAQSIVKNIKLIPGGDKLVEKVVVRLNRAAEDAVTQAAPIFSSAITEMTITDAFNILKGGNNAATQYLKDKTASKLKALFLPKVTASLNKKLVGNISTNESWKLLTSNYNKIANGIAGQLANLEPVNTNLDEYVTDKALDALFLKVANEEAQIRKNPAKRVTDLLKRVFK